MVIAIIDLQGVWFVKVTVRVGHSVVGQLYVLDMVCVMVIVVMVLGCWLAE